MVQWLTCLTEIFILWFYLNRTKIEILSTKEDCLVVETGDNKCTYVCLVFHDELFYDLPRNDVLDLDGEFVGQMEGDVTEGNDGRAERLAAV